MRILHILDHSIPLHSGYAFRSKAIIEQQLVLGWETTQVTGSKQGPSASDEELVDGLRFYRTVPASTWIGRLPVINQLEVVRSLRRRLETIIALEKPDLLQAHSPVLNGLAALSAARAHGLPVVYECRAFWEDAAVDHGSSREGGVRYRLTRALETRVFRSADAITTICEGLAGDIAARGIPREKVTVIPNAVDIARFSGERRYDEGLAASLGLLGKPVVGFIGSFYAYEGLDLLIAGLPRLATEVPEVRVLLVGGGPDDSRLRGLAAHHGVQDRVVFTGRVPQDSVSRYYDLVDIFAYPRHPMRLTDLVTPLKPLEAMARERLVVASDVGGHRELIRDRETGFLFEAGNSEALGEVLARLFSERSDWARVGANGRAFVQAERTWAVSVARYAPLFDALLSRSGRRRFSRLA